MASLEGVEPVLFPDVLTQLLVSHPMQVFILKFEVQLVGFFLLNSNRSTRLFVN
jgi:hypothetical protein